MQFTKYSEKEIITLAHKIADNLDIIELAIHHTTNTELTREEFEIIIDAGLYVIIDKDVIEITEFGDDILEDACLTMNRETRNIEIKNEDYRPDK